MASALHPSPQLVHPVWDSFSAAEKERLLEEDRVAATRVSLILSSLAAAGLFLAAVTLAVILLT